MRNISIIIYKSILVFFPIFFFCLAYIFFVFSYREFTDYVLGILQKKELRLYWERDLMPFSRYIILPYVFAFCGIISALTSFYFFRKGGMVFDFIVTFCGQLKEKIKDFYLDFTKQSNLIKKLTMLFFMLFLCRSFYNIYVYEIQYDEAWTYTNFVNKGVCIAALSPHNNHILYTIIAAIFNYIPLLETKYILRLPVVLAAIVSMLIWLNYWRNKWGWEKALYSTILLACSAPFYIYALYGRGYMFAFLFAILQLTIMSNLYIEKSEKNVCFYIVSLVLAQALGMYALPTYIYVAVVAQIGVLFFTKQYKLWFKINLISIVLSLLLYAPFLLTNGVNILLNAAENKIVYTYDIHLKLYHKLSDWMLWGADYLYLGYFTLILSLYAFYLLYKSTNFVVKYWALWSGVLLLLPLLIFFYQPLRVWSIQLIAYVFLISNFIFYAKAKLPFSKILFPIFFIISIIVQHKFLYAHYEINWAKNIDKEGKKIALLLQEKGISEIFTYSRYDKPLLEYYYSIKNKPVKIYMPYKESKNYRNFSAQKYQAVILDLEDYKPTRLDSVIIKEKKYQLLYKNERLEVYLSEELL